MTNKIYEEYAVLDAQIKALISQKNGLKVQILEELIVNKEKTRETSVGKFTLASLKTWTYTAKVTNLEEDYKALKASEESTGTATFEEKPSLRFIQSKL